MAVDADGDGNASPRRDIDNDLNSFSTAPTVAENTPLLSSGTASSQTTRDASPSRPEDEPLSWGRITCIILSMWALIFLQASNMSGISTTQSEIAADLDSYENAMWFTSSYLITASSVSPLVGRLAMVFSPGAMIMLSSFFFSVGAIITSQAQGFASFIFGRVIVGVGGGGIMTLSLILVIQLTSKRRRGLMIGLTNAGFTIGLSTGAIIYAALLPVLGWRAVFFVQSPIGVLAGLGVYLSMPSFAAMSPTSKGLTPFQKLANIDYAGAITLTTSIFLFLYSLSLPTIPPLPLIISLAIFALFLLIESRLSTHPTIDPIIPLDVLRARGILLSCLSQLGFMAARWTVLFYAPVFVLAVRGLSAPVAGAVLIPTNIGFGGGGLLIGWLHIRRAGSFWGACIVSLVFFTLALAGMSVVSTAATGAWVYIAVIFANGLCTGGALNYTLAHLLHMSRPEVHFIVTGLLSTFRGFAGSFGTAIGGGIFGRTLRGALQEGFERLDGGSGSEAREKLISILTGSPAAVHQEGFLTLAEREIAIAGYEVALKGLYQAAAALCLVVLVVQAGTGWTGPVEDEDEDEIEAAIAEHDGRMEA
ncbi:major facilitator superfamily domain-containing protein [Lasiosphaeris hirsuta]|uniref:Major facilitator superfamily domain-containing protein n=1 Tax=Lasiosphaeris hirsuta TaxID=260670 RepID=A0AA40ARN2_9PEZI|nr:major facilitator superfamily domain-containing protein [Lasiosphaeris hirsuta]